MKIAHVRTTDFGASPSAGQFAYSFDVKKFAETLRRLADHVAAGVVCPQEVTMTMSGKYNDFHTTILTLTYVERVTESPT